MTMGLQDSPLDDDSAVMSEINMTPLVDVMLVLLIVFMITIPVMKHAVSVELPRANSQAHTEKPDAIALTVDAQGTYYWGSTVVSADELADRLAAQALLSPQPELQIRADQAVRYAFVAQALAQAQQAGLHTIGFVTQPDLQH